MNGQPVGEGAARPGASGRIFLLSCAALFTEVMLIRWQTSEIPILGYFKNLPLIAMFLGMGAGCIMGAVAGRRGAAGAWTLGVLSMVTAFATPLGLDSLVFPDPAIDVWDRAFSPTGVATSAAWMRNLAAILAILAADMAAFTWFGRELGRLVAGAPPLWSYSANIGGSLAGVILFILLSRLGTPPAVWAACATVLLLASGSGAPGGLRRHALPFILVAVAGGVSAFREAHEGGLVRWSPYYRVKVQEVWSPAYGKEKPLYYRVDVNRDIHQVLVDTSTETGRRLGKGTLEAGIWEPWRSLYDFPFLACPRPKRMLIGGAGGGNDAAAALNYGVRSVTAVEIDPFLAGLGRSMHPAKPYVSSAVTVVNDDIRGFLGRTRERYDLIAYGILDSHTALSSLSSLRLENFVYTVEGLRAALARLEPGGIMTISFYESDRTWLGKRLYANIVAAEGREPAAMRNEGCIYFAFGPGLDREEFRRRTGGRGRAVEAGLREGGIRMTTDDWPFLYASPQGQPLVYYLTLVLVVVGGWMALARVMGRGGGLGVGSMDWEMAALGAGFMLVQARALTSLSLLYGSTWLVGAAVIVGTMALSGAANALVAARPPARPGPAYVLALGAVLAMTAPLGSVLLGLPFGTRAGAGTLLAVLPVLFSGVAFSSALVKRGNTARALGSNLMGCVFGGAAEAASLVWGIGSLGVLAALFYGAAWMAGAKGGDGGKRP